MTVLKPEFDTLSNHIPRAQNTTTELLNDKTQQMLQEGNDKAAACLHFNTSWALLLSSGSSLRHTALTSRALAASRFLDDPHIVASLPM